MKNQSKSKHKSENGIPANREYEQCVKDLLDTRPVKMMKKFRHHHSVTCFDHCLNVSWYSFMVCRSLHLNYRAAARGGLLHDLFLYDWRTTTLSEGKHAFRHPKIALSNADKICTLNDIERDIIEKHMWPLTLRPPRYIESLVVCLVDKYCAVTEIISSSAKEASSITSKVLLGLKTLFD
ncbi:HD family phosphohydrolase [Thermincola potens]|uniref:Metal dependent phosphohydrolase n=1 Tax=Thermincola potens (strain JR) TaxID=635013 RepID=D5X896_THEPJ|nr:HD family phosphohydrolase [Thermincola potens]ADG82816.1 conserved hypothetical protein [Thermincola potens JR]